MTLEPWKWFGADWGAPVCDPDDHTETPVGEICTFCNQPILAEHQGITMPHVGFDDGKSYVTVRAVHADCQIKHILPHTADCEHCRGMEREEHDRDCNYITRASDGNCTCYQTT